MVRYLVGRIEVKRRMSSVAVGINKTGGACKNRGRMCTIDEDTWAV